MLDLVFMHADIGFPAYRPLAETMIESAKAIFECRPIQIADLNSEPIRGTERLIRSDINAQNMMIKRPEILAATVHSKAQSNVIACDADIVWLRDPHELFNGTFDLGLIWRAQAPAMPYLGCLLLIRQQSEAAVQFLSDWVWTISGMPAELKSWWGDQLALASMLGRQDPNTTIVSRGCRIKLFDAGDIVGTMHTKEHTVANRVYCKHYKGAPAKNLKFVPLEAA